MKKKFLFSSIIVFLIALCGLFYGCGEDKYASLRISAKFSYSEDQVVSKEVKRNGITGVRVKTSNAVFDYYKQTNSYVFYITSSSRTTYASLEVSFQNAPGDFNNGASFNFDNPIAKAKDNGVFEDGVYSKDIIFFESGETNLTAYTNEGNKKTNLNIEVVRVADEIDFAKNNYALPKVGGSSIDLSYAKVLTLNPTNSSITNIEYDFGHYIQEGGEKVFKSYAVGEDGVFDVQKLWVMGLDFDNETNVLSVISELEISDIVIKAVYDNPLGDEEIECETNVKVVEPIEEFELYYGNKYEDAINDNKIGEDDIQNLIVNIEDLNCVDVVLKAKNNQENVLFSFDDSFSVPVYFVKTHEDEYRTVGGVVKTTQLESDYIYSFYKIVAYKKTTENTRYGRDGIFKLNVFADYLDYTVDSYPLIKNANIKNDTLVKNYSVNGVGLSSVISDSSAYNANVYINDVSLGTGLYVDVINPTSVLKENSEFKIAVYKNLGEGNINENISDYFRIRKVYNGNLADVNIGSGNVSFYKQTTLYFQANNNSGKIELGQVYYVVLTSEKPSAEYFNGRFSEEFLKDKKTYATIKLTIVQGLNSIDEYSYKSSNYRVDETTGKFLMIDYANSQDVKFNSEENYYYVLRDKDGEDTLTNRSRVTSLVYDSEKDGYYKLVYGESGAMFYDTLNQNWYRVMDEAKQYYNIETKAFLLEDGTVVQENVSSKKVFVENPCYYIEAFDNEAYYIDDQSVHAYVNDTMQELFYNKDFGAWYKIEEGGIKKYYDNSETSKKFYRLINESLGNGESNREYEDVITSITIEKDITRLDLSSGLEAYFELKYSPIEANLENMVISSSNYNIVRVELEKDENQNEIRHKFKLTPVSVGEAEILIYIANLEKTYRIPVSVYRPITNFYVSLKSSNFSAGVGYYELDAKGKNVELAIVSYGKTVGLNLSTLPNNASDYSMYYTLFEAQKTLITDPEGELPNHVKKCTILNRTYTYSMLDEIASYYRLFDGKTSKDLPIIQDGNYFTYNCSSNSFIFSDTSSIGKTYVLQIRLLNLDGTYFDRFVVLESYSPVETISSTLDKTLLYNPNTIAYVLKTSTSDDPTVVGVKVEVNKNSKAKATFDFDNYGTIRVIFGSNTENFVLEDGVLTNLANKNILLPISVEKDDYGYFWFRLNENYSYNKNNGIIFLVFEVTEFRNIFSKTVAVYVEDAIVTKVISTDINGNQIYFKYGLTEDKEFTLKISPDDVYDKTLLVKTFEVVEIERVGSNNEKIIDTYFVETNVDGISCSVDVKIEDVADSSGVYTLSMSAKRAANNAIVVMPQDKIISRSQFDGWGNKRYVSFGSVLEEDYIENFYYIRSGESYVLSSSYEEGIEYFIRTTDVDEFLDIWQDYLDLYVSVADGVKVPYQISTINDLLEVSSNYESVTKKYVLVDNLTWDTLTNWTPIGNYYNVQIAESDFKTGKFYNKEGENSFKQINTYFPSYEYYEYGFNGSFSGKFSYVDLKNGRRSYYYSITNIATVENINSLTSFAQGFFSALGDDAVVSDISIGYNFYQPSIKFEEMKDPNFFVFGGVAGVNYGKILNSKVTFNNFTFKFDCGGIFGGVAGINFGEIVNSDIANSGFSGNVKFEVETREIEDDKFVDLNIVRSVSRSIEFKELFVGGIVGYNENIIVGSLSYGTLEPVFNDAGFDSSLNITVKGATTFNINHLKTTAIGGVVGYNIGYVTKVSVQGKIDASEFNNVGGIVGLAQYSEKFNSTYQEDEDTKEILSTEYSVSDSYSIVIVSGNDNVGGAFGYIEGNGGSEGNKVKIYYVSAENYAGIYRGNDRTFVKGKNNVGGFAGKVEYAEIKYCYSVSYFDEIEFTEENMNSLICYDVVGVSSCAGFICYVANTDIKNSSSFVNCYSLVKIGIFMAEILNTTASNIFARGVVSMSGGQNIDTLLQNSCGYYNYYYAGNPSEPIQRYFNFTNNGVDKITDTYNTSWILDETVWNRDAREGVDKKDLTNNGLPYLIITIKLDNSDSTITMPLYATLPIDIDLTVKNNGVEKLTSYLKYEENDNSLILFYNLDYANKYDSLKTSIQDLNKIKLTEIANLLITPATYKTYRLDMTTSNSNVVSILNNGDLIVMGEGSVVITVSSKLNANYFGKLNIVVKYGLNDVKLYSNVALTKELDDSSISTLKSRSLTLYAEEEYVREITVGTKGSKKMNVSLKSMSDVGFRFVIREEGHVDKFDNSSKTLSSILNAYSITTVSDIVRVNGLGWVYDGDGGYYYLETPTGVNPILSSILAIDDIYLDIEYIPYIKVNFNSITRTILLNRFAGEFEYNVKRGATEIKAENNIDTIVKFNQLQTQSFTITMYTDFEEDFIISEISQVEYDTYTDRTIFDILENNESKQIDSSNLLNVMQSGITKNYKDSKLESLSVTFTLNYKDKINAIDKDKLYKFYFQANSNSEVTFVMAVVVLSQDKINQVYGTVYAGISDFPQNPEKSNYIYNGIVGVLSLEVYPYISNYTRMKVYYECDLNDPMLITQLSYDITGLDANRLSTYPDSGFISDKDDILFIDKASGQDTFLLNNLGTYSYSKIYFLSLLVSSYVPDDTIYTIYVEFYNRQENLVDTYSFEIRTVAMPTINLEFDKKLLGKDDCYYLPINTKNVFNVDIKNYEGEIDWEVSFEGAFKDREKQLDQAILDCFIPYVKDDVYYVDVMRYNGKDQDNFIDYDMLGQMVVIKGSFVDNRIKYEASIKILITMFTVTSVVPRGLNKGYMTLPLATTTPLQVDIETYYDEALVTEEDNWYANLCEIWKFNSNNKGDFYRGLQSCGYEPEESGDGFINYIIQLKNAITKVDYDFNDVGSENYVKKSGIWFYNDKAGESGYLEILGNDGKARDYNNSTFGFEVYNGYPAVYGYQADINSSLSLKLNLSYIDSKNSKGTGETISGIPNVINYNISPTNTTYKHSFEFKNDFTLNFTYNSDLINAIPISTEEEFLSMEEGKDYRLVSDLLLSNYNPISTKIHSLDGNNYTIYITSFAFNALSSEEGNTDECVLGLFGTLDENAILYNVKVYYTDRASVVTYAEFGKKTVEPNVNGIMQANLTQYDKCTFGGVVGINNGVLTNCQVSGIARIILNYDVNNGVIGSGKNGCIVATNSSTGYLTNCKVKDFNLYCYGETGGIVCENEGKIVSSYFTSSSIENLSSSSTGGFVNSNSGNIYECYVEGYRLSTDNDIRNKGAGILSKGAIGGFVYTNSGIINDCYSNISLSSSTSIAGFVCSDTSSSEISRCYSICYKSQTDNSTVAYIFAGATNYTNIVINGTLNNCYYLSGTGNWSESFTWDSDLATKRATGLDYGKFTTRSFTNFDLSLIYKTGIYQNGEEYKYVDGYAWVTIEGKPVLSSTLVDTISQREYKGKSKTYADEIPYFDASKTKKVEITVGSDTHALTKISYYDNSTNKYNDSSYEFDEEDLVCLVTRTSEKTTYEYYIKVEEEDLSFSKITINYLYNDEKGAWEFENAYTDKRNLDYKATLADGSYEEDKNFRANDAIKIEFDNDGNISIIKYLMLVNVSYFYDDFVFKVSDKVGTRSNPQIIYDYESFDFYLSRKETSANFYRVTKDIDFKYSFPRTTSANFQGVLSGNFMEFNNISVSYLSSTVDDSTERQLAKDSFGLFAEISTYSYSVTDFEATMVSNLTLNLVEVLSNSHAYVGALAGKIYNYYEVIDSSTGGSASSSTSFHEDKVILSNINIQGNNGNRAFVQGKNAVGALAGYVSGDVIIKDISCSVNVNATKEMDPEGLERKYLIYNNYDISNVSYAGGVIGIFDVNKLDKQNNKYTNNNFNANNILVSGNISVIGGVVGSAFGFLGENTVVNYVNTIVPNGDTNFLKAISFAGGLVGENRGTIIDCGVTYGTQEEYSSVRVASSELINHNYFYNSSDLSHCLAIGGLVGLNNGGIVSNCITTVNVRNKFSISAGGAVGLMVAGTLENVVASGAVVAEKYMGGLIGTLEDQANFKSSFGDLPYHATIDDNRSNNLIETVIRNCVAENNWLIKDYVYYKSKLAELSNCVSGFIGVVVHSSKISDNNGDGTSNYLDTVTFEEKNYYSDTVYSTSASNDASLYLKAAYFSHSETVSDISGSVIHNIENVWPYSTREFFYEDTLQDVYFVMKSNNKDLQNTGSNNEVDSSDNPTIAYAYTISSYKNIDNIDDLYTQINLYDKDVWTDIYTDAGATTTPAKGWYIWLVNRFGKIYTCDKSTTPYTYTEVKKTDTINISNVRNQRKNTGYYFVGRVDVVNGVTVLSEPRLDNIKYRKEYNTNSNNFAAFKSDDIKYTEGSISFPKKADNPQEDENLIKINSIWLNGVKYDNLSSASRPSTIEEVGNYIYIRFNLSSSFVFPDGVEVTKIELQLEKVTVGNDTNSSEEYVVKKAYLTYLYDVSGGSEYIYTTTEIKSSRFERQVNLNISSKKIIFKNFNNGYWEFGKDFYLNGNYANTDKYPKNIEFASIFVWTDDNIRSALPLTEENGDIVIERAEELALLSYNVMNGTTYEGRVIKLKNDIDLSGKYWMPIGTNSSPFKGTFDGQGHIIEYAVVNEKTYSTASNLDGQTPEYAGIFGVVDGATIKDFSTIGGNMYGRISGGVIGCINGGNITTISNVINLNNILTNEYGGGIVGKSNSNVVFDENVINYGKVKFNSDMIGSTNNSLYLGGIIGQVKSSRVLTVNRNAVVLNDGNISLVNNKNYYMERASQCIIWKIYVGGFSGQVGNITLNNSEKIVNSGNISVTTNCHLLNVGGLFGDVSSYGNEIGQKINDGENSFVVGRLNNKGNVEVVYRNSLLLDRVGLTPKTHAEANVGGIFGQTSAKELYYSGNDGRVDVTVTTTTAGFIGIGGIAGSLSSYDTNNDSKQEVEQCYNTADIVILTISNQTSVGAGGIVGFVNIAGSHQNLENFDKIIENCYNSGDLKTDGNSQLFIGGILGSFYVIAETTYVEKDTDGKPIILEGNKLRNYILNKTFTTSENDQYGETAFYGTDQNKKAFVHNCLNIGQVALTNYVNTQNSVGAIVGITGVESILKIELYDNYYLSGSAYCGTVVFTGHSEYLEKTSGEGNYYFKNDPDHVYVDNHTTCLAKLSSTLKGDFGTSDVYIDWDTNIWVRQYDTWYPTLVDNQANFTWAERQERTNQEKGKYLIKSADELSYITNQINTGAVDSNNVTIQLTSSIDLAGRYWTPIGNKDFPFKGIFEGNGYTIKNMTIDGAISGINYGGLFGYVVDATISSVGVECPIIKNVEYAGGIAYDVENSRIEKVYTDSLSSNDSIIQATNGVGGIAYSLYDCKPLDSNNNLGGLYRSYNNVPIDNLGSDITILDRTGGLVGVLKSSRIENCYNNSKGIVKVRFINNFELVNSSKLICGTFSNTSSLMYVFNLAKIKGSGGPDVNVKTATTLFEIKTDGSFSEDIVDPVFDNLIKDLDLETSEGKAELTRLKEIWTNEYSLNDEGYTQYPYLRGLGREWKNTESEALTTFVYTTDGNVDPSQENDKGNLSTTEKKILSYISSKELKTMVKILNPDLSYLPSLLEHTCYMISSAEELVWVANNVNNGSLKTSNSEFILLNNIDLAGRFWTPIGISSAYAFQGVFNFNGHVISNLVIDADNLAYGGLFGYVSNACIANGYVKNAFIKLTSTDDRTNVYAGTLVGKGYNTTIKNISVETSLSVYANSGTFVGGIIGSSTGTRDYVIENVHVTASKTSDGIRHIDIESMKEYIIEARAREDSNNNSEIEENDISIGAFSEGGNIFCGGIVGYMSGYPKKDESNEYILDRISTDVNIAAVTLSESSNAYLGGILGYGLEEVTLNDVKNSGKLKSYAVSKFDIIGGIVGYLYEGNIFNSLFDGYIESCQDPNRISYIGGIVGFMENSGIHRTLIGVLENCLNIGRVFSNIKYSTFAAIGGIIGGTRDHVFDLDKDCIYLPSVNGFDKSVGIVEYSSGLVAYLEQLGTDKDEYKRFTIYESDVEETKNYACYYGIGSTAEIFDFMRGKEDSFSELYWSIKTAGEEHLRISRIYLLGCQQSFGYGTNHNLSVTGAYIDSLDVLLHYTNFWQSGDMMHVSFLNKDFETVLIDNIILEDVDSAEFNLLSKIISTGQVRESDINENDLILCYVSLIRVETDATGE